MNCEHKIEDLKKIDVTFNKPGNCVVDWAKSLMEAVRNEICGKCVFCREGTIQVLKIVTDITEGKGHSEDVDFIAEICSTMKETANCQLSKTAANNILNSINEYREEWETHVKRKRCPELICKKLVTYHILGEKCTGCTECFDKCPEGAITGKKDMIHVIDQNKCIQCGICFDICSTVCGAVVKAGAVKPRTPETAIPVGTWQAKGLGLKKGLRANKEL